MVLRFKPSPTRFKTNIDLKKVGEENLPDPISQLIGRRPRELEEARLCPSPPEVAVGAPETEWL